MRILEHPDVLLVTQAAAVASGTAGILRQAELFDDEREAALGELGGQVPGIGHDVDGVLTVRVMAST